MKAMKLVGIKQMEMQDEPAPVIEKDTGELSLWCN